MIFSSAKLSGKLSLFCIFSVSLLFFQVSQSNAEDYPNFRVQVVIPSHHHIFKQSVTGSYQGDALSWPEAQIQITDDLGTETHYTQHNRDQSLGPILKLIDDCQVEITGALGEHWHIILERHTTSVRSADLERLDIPFPSLGESDPADIPLRFSNSWDLRERNPPHLENLSDQSITIHFPQLVATSWIQSAPISWRQAESSLDRFLERHHLSSVEDTLRNYLGYPPQNACLKDCLKAFSNEQLQSKSSFIRLSKTVADERMDKIKKLRTSLDFTLQKLEDTENRHDSSSLVISKKEQTIKALQSLSNSLDSEARWISPFLSVHPTQNSTDTHSQDEEPDEPSSFLMISRKFRVISRLIDQHSNDLDALKGILPQIEQLDFIERSQVFDKLMRCPAFDQSLFLAMLETAIAIQFDPRQSLSSWLRKIRFNPSAQKLILRLIPHSSYLFISNLVRISADDSEFQSKLLKAISEKYKLQYPKIKIKLLDEFLEIDSATGKIILDPVIGRAAFLENVMSLPKEERIPFLAYLELYD